MPAVRRGSTELYANDGKSISREHYSPNAFPNTEKSQVTKKKHKNNVSDPTQPNSDQSFRAIKQRSSLLAKSIKKKGIDLHIDTPKSGTTYSNEPVSASSFFFIEVEDKL